MVNPNPDPCPIPADAHASVDKDLHFKVPLGLSPAGALVAPARASERHDYVCPGCGTPLVLRRGEHRAPHFAHRAQAFCSPETALHRAAKTLIARTFRRRLSHRLARLPRLEVPCSGPGTFREGAPLGRCRGQAWFPLTDLPFDEVAEERSTDGGLRPDVLLLHRGRPVLGIEVLVTHAVDASKAFRASYPWVEVDALQVITAPGTWRPCAQDHSWNGLCRVCHWATQVTAFPGSDHDEPGEAAAELAATMFDLKVSHWLACRPAGGRPGVLWRCPACSAKNRRPLKWERIVKTSRSTSLGPPILPEVQAQVTGGTTVAFRFRAQTDIKLHPASLLPDSPTAVLGIQPALGRSLRLQLTGTNRPWAFLCARCGGDCCGTLPPCWSPVPAWAELDSAPIAEQ